MFKDTALDGVAPAEVQLNALQRRVLDASLGQATKVSSYVCALSASAFCRPCSFFFYGLLSSSFVLANFMYARPKGEGVYLASLELEVGFMQTKKVDPKTYKAEQLEGIVQSTSLFSKVNLSISSFWDSS